MTTIAGQESGSTFLGKQILTDALYATIKLVLDQNKQIKKLKEAVTQNKSNSTQVKGKGPEESRLTDLSFLSIGKDGISPISTVNNFLKDHFSHGENDKINIETLKLTGEKELEVIRQGENESIDETLLQELGKKILKDSTRSKSDPDLCKNVQKNNERY